MAAHGELTHQELGDVFGHSGVAEAYAHRPPYPPDVFDIMTRLITDHPRVVLDLGAGEGAIARTLAPMVDRVDAVDISAAMIGAGRLRPGGDHPGIRWIVGAAETAELDGPYALATAGASLHWMQWETTLGRLAQALSPSGRLVIIDHGPRDVPWQKELVALIVRHSRNPDFDPNFSLVKELQARGLFTLTGTADTAPVLFRQPIQDYVEQFHSTASLARENMTPAEAEEFDRAVERVVRPWARDGKVELKIVATLSWGIPHPPPKR